MKEKIDISEFMQKLCQKLIDSGIATQDQIQGCSKEEISQIEVSTSHPLPEIYKEFLFYMGYKAGKFFRGTDIFYNHIFKNRLAAIEVLEEIESDFKLAPTDFVFASHQGYQFMYFNLYDNDNPSVYYFIEGATSPYKK